jgi:hypothetical protein
MESAEKPAYRNAPAEKPKKDALTGKMLTLTILRDPHLNTSMKLRGSSFIPPG